MTAVAVLLAVGCLGVGAFHLARLGLDPPREASHAAMGIGMAAMFSPSGDPVPAAVWIAVFTACGAWFAADALRSPAGSRRSDAVHHVVGSGAMLFMLLGGHGGGVAGTGAVHAGHVGHGAGTGLGLSSPVALVLAGYFAWHVLRCADHLRACAPRDEAPAGGPVAVRSAVLRDARSVALAHLVMAAATAVMLLGMV